MNLPTPYEIWNKLVLTKAQTEPHYTTWSVQQHNDFFRFYPELRGEQRHNPATIAIYETWLRQRYP